MNRPYKIDLRDGQFFLFFDKKHTLLAATCCNVGVQVSNYRLYSRLNWTAIHMCSIVTNGLQLRTMRAH